MTSTRSAAAKGNDRSIQSMFRQGKQPGNDSANEEMILKKLEKLNKIDELTNAVKELRDEINNLKGDVQEIREVRQNLQSHTLFCKTEHENTNRRITELENKIETYEKDAKSQNVVIFGLDTAGQDPARVVSNLFEEQLKIDVKVKQVRTLGLKNEKRLIVVKLDTMEEKIAVMKAKIKLKNTTTYITNDRTYKERDIQRKIMSIAKEEEGKGKEIKIGFKKLSIDGVDYNWVEGKGLMQSFSGRRNSSSPSRALSQEIPRFI